LHGLHYNRKGKAQIIKQVISEIIKIIEITEIMVPNLIRLGWKTDSDQEGTTNIMNTINIEGVHEGNAGLRTDPQTKVDPQIAKTKLKH